MSQENNRAVRVRKNISRFVPAIETKNPKATVVESGTGVRLGEIPSIELALKKCSEEDLRALHSILFGKLGQTGKRKKMIRSFNGFSPDDPDDEVRVEKLSNNKSLKEVCEILSIPTSGTRVHIAEQLNEFLKEPKILDEPTLPKKRGKVESSSKPADVKRAKKSKKSGEAPTRPLSGYMQYVVENRSKVQRENPDMKNTEVVARLGELWRELDDSDKDDYKKTAQELFIAAGGPEAAAAAKKRKAEEKESEKEAKKSMKASKSVKDKSAAKKSKVDKKTVAKKPAESEESEEKEADGDETDDELVENKEDEDE